MRIGPTVFAAARADRISLLDDEAKAELAGTVEA
jgi:hypothetical protein